MEATLTISKNDLNQSANNSYNTQEQIMTKTSAMTEISSATKNIDQVQVKFILDSSNNFRTIFRKDMTIATMKEKLADVLDMDEMGIMLKRKNQKLDDSKCLDELVDNPLVPVEIKLSYMNSKLAIEKFKENIPLLDVITVHPQYGEFENITVVIEDQSFQKQWLGGYRNKRHGIDYHHAVAQTTPEYDRVRDKAGRFHRETQTVELKTTATGTVMSRGTQMGRRDHYITSNNDKFIVARPFKSHNRADTQLQNAKARVIQRFWRSYLRRKELLNTWERLKQNKEAKRKLSEEIALEYSLGHRLILTGAVYPSKRDDFYWLYLSLGLWIRKKWTVERFQRTVPSRKAMIYLLLMREINCLYSIEKHRIDHKKEVVTKEGMRFLEMTARPKIFKNKTGNLVCLDDIETRKARELKEIYSELIKREVKPIDRIHFLNTFRKLFAANYATFEYASEIVSLVDRETLLITMGMRNKDLKGVRMRIEQLYMHFVQQKEFNPKASQYEKPNLPHSIRLQYMCARCSRLLPASKFPVHFRMKDYCVCTSCQCMYDTGHVHTDLAPYKRLLTQVRRDEMDICSQSAICFLLQPPGMAYLTTKIWHDHSAISECNVMQTLRHVRWLQDVEWSPWNTILLTAEEAQFHCFIPDVYDFYDPSFIMLVRKRHIMAKNHFEDLEKVNLSLCSSGEWTSAEESDFYFQKYYAEDFVAKDDFDIM